jgi:hypothetical protein
MSFTPPTIAQFKAQFPRDFPYGSGLETVQDNDIQAAINLGQGLFNPSLFSQSIPSFSTTITGNTTLNSDVVDTLSSVTGLAPGQAISGAGIPASTTITFVGASSIVISQNATATAASVQLTIGGVSGYSVSEAQIAYLYLSAHLMCLSIQNAGGLGAPAPKLGVLSTGGGVIQTKGVGSVNIGYSFPDYVINSPTLSQYLRTGYGHIYLQMVTPKLPGRRVMVVGGEPTIGGGVPQNNATAFIPTGPL